MRYFDGISTPIGRLYLVASDSALVRVHFPHESWDKTYMRNPNHPILLQAKRELREYFAGTRKSFSVPLGEEGTVFQKKAWEVLKKIPYGSTITYKEEAERIGNENTSRAVGNANAKNPLPIFIPCHRVISSSGMLGGYSGGEAVKNFLLQLEQLKK